MLLASLTALLLACSQAVALYADEGFHLLAARLGNAVRKLYLDFFYPHAPLYIETGDPTHRVTRARPDARP